MLSRKIFACKYTQKLHTKIYFMQFYVENKECYFLWIICIKIIDKLFYLSQILNIHLNNVDTFNDIRLRYTYTKINIVFIAKEHERFFYIRGLFIGSLECFVTVRENNTLQYILNNIKQIDTFNNIIYISLWGLWSYCTIYSTIR